MKQSILKEHREFFRKHGAIEFEDLVSDSQLDHLEMAINVGLSSRLEVQAEKLSQQSPKKLYMAGRDLWRSNHALKKIITQKNWAVIAEELLEMFPLRIGFDQFIPASLISKTDRTLEGMSSLHGLVCGLLVAISGPSVVKAEEIERDVFPSKPGNGVFFRASLPLTAEAFRSHMEQNFILIVYGQDKTVYRYNAEDPHGDALKSFGYQTGDRLKNKYHPIV